MVINHKSNGAFSVAQMKGIMSAINALNAFGLMGDAVFQITGKRSKEPVSKQTYVILATITYSLIVYFNFCVREKLF